MIASSFVSSLPLTLHISKGNSGALAGFAEKPTSGSSNVPAELAVKAHPFFIRLTKSERLAIAATAYNVWPCPLASLPSVVCGCRSVLRFEFIERFKRSFQFWCGDGFHTTHAGMGGKVLSRRGVSKSYASRLEIARRTIAAASAFQLHLFHPEIAKGWVRTDAKSFVRLPANFTFAMLVGLRSLRGFQLFNSFFKLFNFFGQRGERFPNRHFVEDFKYV